MSPLQGARSNRLRAWLNGKEFPVEGLSAQWLAVAFLASLALVFSRRPSDVLHAQFYAEDGMRWFAQAYNLHWLRALAIPDASYLQVLPRLVAALALWLPFRWVPLMMNLVGASLQALPVAVLLSRRCSPWGSLPMRGAMAAIYLANPNAFEVHVVLTNAQWHLALLQVFVAFSLPARTWLTRGLDVLLFLLGSVSGPFAIALLPLTLVYWWVRRQPWTLAIAATLATGVIVQVHSILTGARVPELPLGATVPRFLQIVGGSLFVNSIFGQSVRTTRLPLVLLLLVIVAAIALLGFAWWKAPLAFRLYVVYAFAWFAGGLKSPVIFEPLPRWNALLHDAGMRYYLFPTLAFVWAAVYCARLVPIAAVRNAAYALLAFSIVGDLRKWEYPAFTDHHFASYAARFEALHPGQTIDIPIYPDPWHVYLIKH